MRRNKKMDLKTLQETPPWDWPDGTGKMLLGVLTDSKAPAADRLTATELAGETTVIDDKLAEALLAILRDGKSTDEIRAQAALSLGPALEHSDLMGFDDPEDVTVTEGMFEKIQSALSGLFADTGLPVEVRRRILEASVRAPQPWHADAIRAALPERASGWRLTAVFCMRYVRGFDAQVLEAMSDPDPAIRCEAVLAAGAWELDAAWPQVEALLRSKKTDKPLLLAAIEAAASLRPEEAPELLEHLAESEDEDIADAVAEALESAEVAALHKDGDWEDDDDLDDEDEDGDEDDEEDDDDEEEDESGSGGKVLN